MKRPTFFLSSTIFDFSDLRSSIKYFLEQRGCKVLASEYNDFEKPLDEHSYDACLKSIENADYFLLLVGSRVGGWYDPSTRTSITQQEYRTAYQLHERGQLRIVPMVRREVWTFRENHKALERHLMDLDLDPTKKGQIISYKTKFADDAKFIIDFIEEIGRSQQTKVALSTRSTLPTGNWIHTFSEFKDISDVLTTLLPMGLPVDEAAFRRALRHELLELLRSCLIKTENGIFGPRWHVDRFRDKLKLSAPGPEFFTKHVEVPTDAWDQFSSLMIAAHAIQLNVYLLPQALASSTFLTYDVEAHIYSESPVFDALHKLRQEVELASVGIRERSLNPIYTYSKKQRGRHNSYATVSIPFSEIAPLVALAYRWVNIVELCSAIISHFDGNPFNTPSLMPRSPIEDHDEKLEAEQATKDEALSFVREMSRRESVSQANPSKK
jgi:hypothetical protein